MTARLVRLIDELEAHASGAAWIASQRTLLVADLHLGRGWALRRRGELWPVAGDDSAAKLDRAIDELKPAKVVLLGDAVHAPSPCGAEREEIERCFRLWQSQVEIVLVRGNHDRAFDSDFRNLAVPCMEWWQGPGFMALHGDKPPTGANSQQRLVLGHLHPALSMQDAAGVGHKLPVFLIGARTVVLPAFSALSAGADLWRGIPEALTLLEGSEDFQAIAASGRRVVPVGRLADLINAASAGISPEHFRRRR